MMAKTHVDEMAGPFATPARAAEIAVMEEFGLAEFTELTGVGVGDFSIYHVGQDGISLAVAADLAAFTARQQNAIHQAARHLTLAFPCAPALFVKWYDATRGATPHPRAPPGAAACSDFPLAEGFVEALNGDGITKQELKDSVTSRKIVAAFRVKADLSENASWWQNRMRHAPRYHLKAARAARGRAQNPSRWFPLQIAVWLISNNHLSQPTVRRAVEEHFPQVDSSLL